MKIKDVKKLTPLERLIYWIEERDHIRSCKEAGLPKPWTDDEIFQNYRFCNVRRIDDAVSQWLLTHWYTPYKDHSRMLVAVVLARHFNLPAALDSITAHVFTQWRPSQIKQILRARKATGQRIFNGAYMVRGIGTSDKTEMVVDRVVAPLVKNPPLINTTSMELSVKALLPYWGFSSFMAGQVVADLRWAITGTWSDRQSWAPIGPGSKRGINRAFGRTPGTPIGNVQWEYEFATLSSLLRKKIQINDCEAIDLQNCLCEYDKYTRCLTGQGRPKQRYPGEK